MNWNKLTDPGQLEEIKALSHDKPVLIFKHSTRCSISSMSLDRLLRNWKSEDSARVIPYYLDLIAFRSISDQIEDFFGVPHESPQVLLIKDGQVVYDESHYSISYPAIMEKI
jgi:bacillithiol system protein YtxJ